MLQFLLQLALGCGLTLFGFAWYPWCGPVDCTVFFDDFDRADSSTIGADWTETAGNWEILSNKLKITTASAVLTYSTAFACANWHRLSAIVRSSASGDCIRVGAAELVIGTGKLRLYETIGGTPTIIRECDVTASTNTDYKLTILNGTYTSTIYLDDVAVLAASALTGTTRSRTLGTGGTVTGTVLFNDFRIEESAACTSDCPESLEGCWPVVDGANPDQVEVVLSGGATGFWSPCSAGECSAFDGTYVLDKVGIYAVGLYAGHLLYELTGLSLACGGATITRARLYVNAGYSESDLIGDCTANFVLDSGDETSPALSLFGALGNNGSDAGHHPGVPGETAGCGSAAISLTYNTDVITGGPYQREKCTGTSAVCTPV